MKMKFLRIAVCWALLAPSSAMAVQVLDQEHFASVGGSGGLSKTDASFRRAQTVTAGLTGTLTRIEIFVGGTPGNFAGFNILDTDGSALPTTSVLATGSLLNDLLPGDTSGWVSFSTSLAVTAGQVFALEPIEAVAGSLSWLGSGNLYAGGSDNFVNVPFGITNFRANPNLDLFFRTFVTTGAVPEPQTWAMFVLGFGAVGHAVRRRNSASARRTTA